MYTAAECLADELQTEQHFIHYYRRAGVNRTEVQHAEAEQSNSSVTDGQKFLCESENTSGVH